MKKIIVIFAFFSIGTFILLESLDQGDYRLEKRLWHLDRRLEELARDPAAVPEQEIQALLEDYRRTAKAHPNSPRRAWAYLQMGRLQRLEHRPQEALASFQKVLKDFPNVPQARLLALLHIGRIDESQGREAEAVRTYERIMNEYRFSPVAIRMPFYIMNYYHRIKRPEKERRAFLKAEAFYRKLAEQYEGKPLGYSALVSLFATYAVQRQWPQAAGVQGRILLHYASPKFMSADRIFFVIKSINTISILHMKSMDYPIELYRTFIKKYPKHPLNDYLERVIDKLREAEKGLRSSSKT